MNELRILRFTSVGAYLGELETTINEEISDIEDIEQPQEDLIPEEESLGYSSKMTDFSQKLGNKCAL